MKTPRFNKAYAECLDDTGNITRLEPLYEITRELETELNAFCAELGCTDLTPSGNVVMAMVKLKELQKNAAAMPNNRI